MHRLLFVLLFIGGAMGPTRADDAKKPPKYSVISGLATSEIGEPKQINFERTMKGFEAWPKGNLDHFSVGDVFGYCEDHGKFWIIVSSKSPPFYNSPASTLFGYLNGYKIIFKNEKVDVRDISRVELKQFPASNADPNQPSLGQIKRQPYRMISGLMASYNHPMKINLETILRELEASPRAPGDHFSMDDVFGYCEDEYGGKFHIFVSASSQPPTKSSALTLYEHLLCYWKNSVSIRDLTTTEMKQLPAPNANPNQAPQGGTTKENETGASQPKKP